MSLELESIRAFCEARIAKYRALEAKAGAAAAHEQFAVAAACQQLLDDLDAMPPATVPERIPAMIRRTLDDYATHHLPPGQCIAAVLAGDLFGAMRHMDAETAAMEAYART